jgi:hypothetical protein
VIKITYFIGTERNTKRGTVVEFENLQQLSEEFKECKEGGKHSAYFVRGELYPMHRKDTSLKTSNLLVIDGDIGMYNKAAPAPELVHAALCKMNLNHFIYTTHSHAPHRGIMKYRVVIPTDDFKKDDIRRNLAALMLKLKDNGIEIKTVKEMKAWTQPWFMPYRDDPDDGFYEFYTKFDGLDWELVEGIDDPEEVAAEKANDEAETLDEMYENIRSGREYHESMLNISYQLVKDGMSKAHVKAHLRAMLNASKDAGSERWLSRFEEIDRMVDGAAEYKAPEIIVGIAKKIDPKQMPFPPGALGDLFTSAYNSLLYQYEEVALVSSVGLIAGIAGRRYNIMHPAPMGLNVYMTLVAGTGFGKERISRFIEYCLLSSQEGLKSFGSFYGAGSFTSAKAIYNQFVNARSQVCVASEAGLLMKVKSGNVEAKTAMLLDMYSKSDRHSWTKGATYSDKDNSIPPLRAVAMTLISESTERSLMEAFGSSNALESGYLPRQSIFKIQSEVPKANRNCKLELSNELIYRLNRIMDDCSSVQAQDDSQAKEIWFEDDIIEDTWDYQEKCDRLRSSQNGIEAAMATRMFVKAVKYAGIATVFNHMESSKIGWTEWNWGKAMADYEINNVLSSLGALVGDGVSAAVIDVCVHMTLIFAGKAKRKSCVLSKYEMKYKCIPRYDLEAACMNLASVKNLGQSAGGTIKTGIAKVLEYMAGQGAILLLDKAPSAMRFGAPTIHGNDRKRYVQATDMFDSFCQMYVERFTDDLGDKQ